MTQNIEHNQTKKELRELKLQLQSALMLMEYLYKLKNDGESASFQALHLSFYEDAKRELESAERHATGA